jgi:hypothetical protein
VLEKEAPETAPDGPLLDLSDAAVKKLTHSAKKRGYVTHDQINSILPSEEVNSQGDRGRPQRMIATRLCSRRTSSEATNEIAK